jgi:hypothetical protein
MDVRVAEARHDDVVTRVDDDRLRRGDRGPDLGDPVPDDEHVADSEVAHVAVHRQHRPASEEDLLVRLHRPPGGMPLEEGVEPARGGRVRSHVLVSTHQTSVPRIGETRASGTSTRRDSRVESRVCPRSLFR